MSSHYTRNKHKLCNIVRREKYDEKGLMKHDIFCFLGWNPSCFKCNSCNNKTCFNDRKLAFRGNDDHV
jgi:predicted metal-binding protein